VVIVTYQNAAEIENCLTSLHRASSHPLQVLIADNASTDGTPEILHNLIRKLSVPHCTFDLKLHAANLGFTRALNLLLQRAAGDFTLFLNPDTSGWPRGGLDQLVERLLALPEIGVAAPQLLNDDGTVQPSCRRFPTPRDLFFELTGLSALFLHSSFFNRWKMGDFDHAAARDVDQPQGACLLARREVIERVGQWDERFPMFFSDVDWCQRVWQAGWRIRFVPEVKIVHHQGVSVHQRRPAMIWTSHRSFFDYLCKYRRDWRSRALNVLSGGALLIAAICRIGAYYLTRGIERRGGK
jgi:GT2 family glycosyltransferase